MPMLVTTLTSLPLIIMIIFHNPCNILNGSIQIHLENAS